MDVKDLYDVASAFNRLSGIQVLNAGVMLDAFETIASDRNDCAGSVLESDLSMPDQRILGPALRDRRQSDRRGKEKLYQNVESEIGLGELLAVAMASLFIEKGACSMGDLVAKGFSLEEIALFWGVAEGLFGAKLARCFDDPGRTD